MSEEELPPLLQACPNCSALLDVGDQEPFEQIHCPMCGQSMRARTQFNNFAIEEPLGSGGMGAVYKARDVNLDRLVALKVVKREFSVNPEYVANFEREAVITASVNDPHVVKVFSFGSDRGTYYIAMELVDKGSLDSLITLQGTVAESQVLQVGIQIASGLKAALQLGLIHRDVKPGNILFADANTAKIVDFGLALLMKEEADAHGEIWGTPYYIAPEKLNRQPEDFRSDIYSLGGTLFHALAGRPPFEAETASMVALKHIKSQAVSLQSFAPDVSSATAYVINRMLCKEPNDRYQSYDELIEHLTYARTQLLESRLKPREKKRVVVESKSEQMMAMVIAVLLVVAIGALGYYGWKYRTRVFTAAPSTDEVAATQKKDSDAQIQKRYGDLRAMMAGGDFASAQQGFHELASSTPPLPQPLLSFVTFHEGLCALLDDRLEDAQDIFQQLYKGGMFSTDAEQAPLANFFVETSRLVSTKEKIPGSSAHSYKSSPLDPLTLLVFALKDWELKAMDDADVFFTAFVQSKPEGELAWIASYQPLVKSYRDDLQIYLPLEKEAAAASGTAQPSALLQKIRSARDRLQHGGKMLDAMTDLQARVQIKAGQAQAVEKEHAVAEHTHDQQVLASAGKTYHAELEAFACESIGAPWRQLTVGDSAAQATRTAMLQKCDWLAAFKAHLLTALNTTGYPKPAYRRNGVLIPPLLTAATEKSLTSRTTYGSVTIPWTEVAPKSIVEMASYFREKQPDATARAQFAWTSGVYAYEVGLTSAGRDLLLDASQTEATYRDQLALFFN